MTFLTDTETQLQVDSRGRVRVPKERQDALLDEFARSGMTARAFARMVGVKEVTFSAWHLRRRKEAKEAPMANGPVKFLEAVTEERERPNWNGALVVELAGGARVEVQSPGQLQMVAELIRLVGIGNRGSQC